MVHMFIPHNISEARRIVKFASISQKMRSTKSPMIEAASVWYQLYTLNIIQLHITHSSSNTSRKKSHTNLLFI